MNNAPKVKTGIVAVSRDCFLLSLSASRKKNVVNEYRKAGGEIADCPTVVENEKDAVKALKWLSNNGVNALVLYLGNFGPEGPETMLAQRFPGPVMLCAAAEETTADSLVGNRGDAFCGMLSASYNLGLRSVRVYIPEYPVGTPDRIAEMISEFVPIARTVIGVGKLKIFTFGPRPYDFLACNAPIKPLFDLGVEIQENSELDLFESFNKHRGDFRIGGIKEEMNAELCGRNDFPSVLDKLAQLEVTLEDWMEANLGACEYAAFANKCWPAFQTSFGCVPCYVNSRLAARGIPVSCETDIYGALTEYILYLASGAAPTLLDINNTVPRDMYDANREKILPYKPTDLFMGFHCGNTSVCNLKKGSAVLRYQYIMKRNLEPDGEPDISRGSLDGQIKSGDITLFRLQGTADCKLRAYIAQGEVLDIDPCSFGGIGVIAIPEMKRFYRNVMLEKKFPHHTGVGFARIGKPLFEILRLLGIGEIDYNHPAGLPYEGENPF